MISIIAAYSENNVIGAKGEIPWYLSTDLKRFATLTKGHTVIMGRKTYESIINRLGNPLPNRKNIILSSKTDFTAPGCEIFSSLKDAIDHTNNDGEVFIIGGEKLYNEAVTFADKMYLTEVHVNLEGDAFFPTWQQENWNLNHEEIVPHDKKNQFESTYRVFTIKV